MKTKTKKWFKKNWMNLVIIGLSLVLIIGIIGVIFFLSDLNLTGLVTNLITSTKEVNQTQFNEEPEYSCDADFRFTEDEVCLDEETTAKIEYDPNSRCAVGFRYEGSEWRFYDDVTLDDKGEITLRETPVYAGEYIFAAYCINPEGEGCRTNNDEILVVDCSGSNDYNFTCSDSDDGINLLEQGYCRDSPIHLAQDYCSSTSQVFEYECKDNKCVGASITCPAGYQCVDGACVDTPSVGDTVATFFGEGQLDTETLEDIHERTLDMGDVETGDCTLGVEVTYAFNYSSGQYPTYCDEKDVSFAISDSTGTRWSKSLYEPAEMTDDKCPISWDGTDFKIKIINNKDELCQIEYAYQVDFYICEC